LKCTLRMMISIIFV